MLVAVWTMLSNTPFLTRFSRTSQEEQGRRVRAARRHRHPEARGSQPLRRSSFSRRMNGRPADTQVRAQGKLREARNGASALCAVPCRYSRQKTLFYSCNKPRTRKLSPLPHERNPRLREGKEAYGLGFGPASQLHSRLPVSVITLAPPHPRCLGPPN